jgi:predicted nucleic acid-binding Zn ribbon protein
VSAEDSGAPTTGDGPRITPGALQRARAAARKRGTIPARSATPFAGGQRGRRPSRPVDPALSGAGPDDRDPTLIGNLVEHVAEENGWRLELAVGSLAGRWPELVGADVAAHCRPERFEAGELVLVAESTAWATQLRLLAPTLIARIAAVLGQGLVRQVNVRGPAAPNWRRGPWRVAGRGPRDTYG